VDAGTAGAQHDDGGEVGRAENAHVDLLVTHWLDANVRAPADPRKTTKVAGRAMAHFGRSWPFDLTGVSAAR
jgi:hypothetical protein